MSVFDDKIDNPITIGYLKDNGFHYGSMNGKYSYMFNLGALRFDNGTNYIESDMVLVYYETTNNFHLMARFLDDDNGWITLVYRTLDVLINPDKYTFEIYINNLLKNRK